ncbi:nitrile hydratase subunit beta [Natronorarus salvus]|uniref:nitrile hydratase subunit beta n=1 Tax=Natronorarus salvus TaxID=3117733 RepID=UPI002F25F58E
MNGIHDMGGMHGFGEIDVDDASFHDDWERAVFAVEKLLRYQSIYGIDEKRHAIERIDPETYLNVSYFERWALGSETLLLENGTIDQNELRAAVNRGDGINLVDDRATDRSGDGELVKLTRDGFRQDAAYDRDPIEPQYNLGMRVVVRNDHPAGHTRCPRYVRRARGTIEDVRGTYVVPDEAAHGEEVAEPLYAVRFNANDLWNDDTDGDAIYVDLWERHLKRASETTAGRAATEDER